MTYSTGTVLTNPTPAFGMRDVLEAALTAHGNWEFVKTVPNTPANVDQRVWRCKGAGNGFGTEFYLFLVYNLAGTGNLTYYTAETFNATTNVFGHPCPLENTTATAPAADFSFGGATTYNVSTYATNAHLETLALSTTQFDYFVLVGRGHIMVNVRVGSVTNGIYIGLFDSLMTTDPFPLVIFNPGNISVANVPLPGTFSRMPDVTGSVARQFAVREFTTLAVTAWTNPAVLHGGQVGLPGLDSGDLYAGGVPLGSRVLLTPLNYTSPGLYGAIRGLCRDLLYFETPTAVQPGDTMTVSGQTWVLTGALPTSSTFGLWMNTEAI